MSAVVRHGLSTFNSRFRIVQDIPAHGIKLVITRAISSRKKEIWYNSEIQSDSTKAQK